MPGEFLDQIFVRGKQWLLSFLAGAPDWVVQLASSLINILVVLHVFLALGRRAAATFFCERNSRPIYARDGLTH